MYPLVCCSTDYRPLQMISYQRHNIGTNDTILSLQQIQEKYIEQNIPLYMIFVDQVKAFHIVNRDALWNILHKLECFACFVKLISALHTGMKASINLKGELSELFEISNRVKQDCVLSSTLFSIFLSMVLSDALTDSTYRVWIQSGMRASLFNASQFKAARKTRNVMVHKVMFANNTVFMSQNHQAAQEMITHFLKSKGILAEKHRQENQHYVPTPSRILWRWPRHTDRGPGTNPSKQIQISRLHSHHQQQTRCRIRYTNIKCFKGLWQTEEVSLAQQRPHH